MLLLVPGVFADSLSVSYEILDGFSITDMAVTAVQPDVSSVNYHYTLRGYDELHNQVSMLRIEISPLQFTADPDWFEGDQQITVPQEGMPVAIGTVYMPYAGTMKYLTVEDVNGEVVLKQDIAKFISHKADVQLDRQLPKQDMTPWLVIGVLILVAVAAILGTIRHKR